MEDFNQEIKNRKLLLIAAISAILIIAVLIITIAINKKKPVSPVAPAAPKEETMEDLVNDLTASTDEANLKPFPSEDIKSLTATVNYNGNLNAGAKNNKAKNPVLAPIPEDDLKSLTAPAVK